MDILSLPPERLVAPEPLTAAEVADLVAAAVWAPSVHNTQPWWFSASGARPPAAASILGISHG